MAKIYSIIFSYHSKYPKKVESDYRRFFSAISETIGLNIPPNEVFLSDFLVPAYLNLPSIVSDSKALETFIDQYSDFLASSLETKLLKNELIESLVSDEISNQKFKFTKCKFN